MCNQVAPFLKEALINQSALQELYVHWNRLKSQSNLHIFTGLENNTNLKVLDLSWNSLGTGNALQIQVINIDYSLW